MKKTLTLCMVCREGEILLGMKKRGFGAGRWNGFGGKLDEGETVQAAARRELEEEAGIVAGELKEAGVIGFTFQSEPKELEVHIFRVDDFTGEPVETEEMKPQWFPVDQIPYEQMWSDDIHWLPLLLANKRFRGRFLFDRPSDAEHSAVIIEQHLEVVDGQ